MSLIVAALIPHPSNVSSEINYLIGALFFSGFVFMIAIKNGRYVYRFSSAFFLLPPFLISGAVNLNGLGSMLELLREFAKVFLFPLALVLMQSYLMSNRSGRSKRWSEKETIRVCVVAIGIQIAFSFNQFFDVVPAINEIYFPEKITIGTSLSEKIRLVGSFSNPNYFGLYLSVLASVVLSAFRVNSNLSSILLIIIAALVLFSGSRTAIISFVLLMGITAVKTRSILMLVLAGFIVASSLVIFQEIERLKVLLSIEQMLSAKSAVTRLEILIASVNLILEKPIFGYFTSPIQITDNYYALVVLRYGLFYLALFIFLLWRTGLMHPKFIGVLSVFAVSLLTGAFLDNFQVLMFLVAALAIVSKSDLGSRKRAPHRRNPMGNPKIHEHDPAILGSNPRSRRCMTNSAKDI